MKIKITVLTILIFITALPVYGASIPLPNKNNDEVLKAMINETLPKFQTMNYQERDFILPCNVFLPEDYPGDREYPLVVFIADGSVIGQGADAPLRQGYGGIVWATDKFQAKHKCIVAVPQYPELILDDNSGYTMTNYIRHTENLVRSLIAGFRVDPDKIGRAHV